MKLLHVSILLLLTSCASLRYPNWKAVEIKSCIQNLPCEKKGKIETCSYALFSSCNDWFKKRATIVNANTVLQKHYLDKTVEYFQCNSNLSPYKEYVDYKFDSNEYVNYLKPSDNKVSGQAFLRQKGGDIVTCAGYTAFMYPDTPYYNELSSEAGIRCNAIIDQTVSSNNPAKSTQCDAQGNFEFYHVPAGNYLIVVNVSWDIPWYVNKNLEIIGGHQGGILRKKISVLDGEANKFIVSE